MEDLFNFDSSNILGTPKNIQTTQAKIGGSSYATTTVNDDSKKEEKKPKSIKIVIVGDAQVGKTGLIYLNHY